MDKKRLFNLFNPTEALPENDPRYVDCSVERGSVGLLTTLAETIRLSENPVCQLISGHRGCGKTTELFRLRDDLFTKDPCYFVVYCESDNYIDINDVEYMDVLMAVVQQLWIDADKANVDLAPGRLKGFVQELWGFLNREVEIKEIGIKAGLFDIKTAIKNDPDYRQIVRQKLRPSATSFLDAINAVIEEAEQAFIKQGYAGLVIIIDNLDRVLPNKLPNSNRTTQDDLFITYAGQLNRLACHTIYTLPLDLIHSPAGANLVPLYGNAPKTLPMVPTTTRSGAEDTAGMAKLAEMIDKRLAEARTSRSEAFDSDESVKRICAASGGYVRGLMALVRQALLYSRASFTSEAIDQAIRDIRDRVTTTLKDTDWTLLREIARTKFITKDERCLVWLNNLTVLEYRDKGGQWYDVNPLIKEADRFNE